MVMLLYVVVLSLILSFDADVVLLSLMLSFDADVVVCCCVVTDVVV